MQINILRSQYVQDVHIGKLYTHALYFVTGNQDWYSEWHLDILAKKANLKIQYFPLDFILVLPPFLIMKILGEYSVLFANYTLCSLVA